MGDRLREDRATLNVCLADRHIKQGTGRDYPPNWPPGNPFYGVALLAGQEALSAQWHECRLPKTRQGMARQLVGNPRYGSPCRGLFCPWSAQNGPSKGVISGAIPDPRGRYRVRQKTPN